VAETDGWRQYDFSYASPMGGRVTAYLVTPAGGSGVRHPGVLFVHPGQGDRSTFLEEARGIAACGIVSLLIDGPFARPDGANPQPPPYAPGDLAKGEIHLIVDSRRGLDALSERTDVDPSRVGYVGHSLGATSGGVLVGLERRLLAAVLMAGFASEASWWRTSDHPIAADARRRLDAERFERLVREMEPLAAERYLPYANPTALLFQFARHDQFIPEDDARRSVDVASEPKEARWYDTDHFFDDRARRERVAWLTAALGAECPG